MKRNNFGELLTAMVTPFDSKGEVDFVKVRELALYLVNNGSDGLVVLGTTGEVPTLSREEKEEILKVVVDEVGDRAEIIAGTGSYSTKDSIEMTEIAEKIGVDGIMAVVPYYNKPPQSGLYKHFSLIAESTSLPVMIYNVPGRTAKNIEVATVLKLSEIENIIAIKEASGNLSQVAELCNLTDDDFYVYSGDDSLILPVLSVGGQGIISVAGHIVGNRIKKMIRSFKDGDNKKAISLNKELFPIFKGMFISTNPISVKESLNKLGIDVGGLRLPLVELTEKERKKLDNILENADLI